MIVYWSTKHEIAMGDLESGYCQEYNEYYVYTGEIVGTFMAPNTLHFAVAISGRVNTFRFAEVAECIWKE